jgi:hypothetical protein
VLYIIMRCGFIDLLIVYKIEKNKSRINKMIVMGIEQVITYPNLFTHYEQYMVKSIVLFYYYNNVYQIWYEHW